jgi:hypothetical protein
MTTRELARTAVNHVRDWQRRIGSRSRLTLTEFLARVDSRLLQLVSLIRSSSYSLKNVYTISFLLIAFVVPDGEEEPIDPPASSRMSGGVGSTIARDRSSIGKWETILGLFCVSNYSVLIHNLLIGPLPDSLVQSAPVSSGSMPTTPGVAPQGKSLVPSFQLHLFSSFRVCKLN